MMKSLEASVYAPVIDEWNTRGTKLSLSEKEKLWRMHRKAEWRLPDAGLEGAPPENRIKLLTQRDRKAYQWGGEDEKADPAAPFTMKKGYPRPKGMPLGSYNLSSGSWGLRYESTAAMLRNETPTEFEIVYQQVTHDGQIVTQHGGYADPNSSRGWDGRLEYQPDGKGGREIVITQGAMELPGNLQGAERGVRPLPEVSRDNEFRARHLFKMQEWIPAKNGQSAKLIVRDAGSILDFKPTTERRYIQVGQDGNLIHAHGYGEVPIPDPADPQKVWVDPKTNRTYRVFDMVTKETTYEETLPNGEVIRRFVPTETKSVGVAMDSLNPSKRDPKAPYVFFTQNQIPGTDTPMPATIRYAYKTEGKAVEQRILQPDGKVKIITDNIPQNEPALLGEGLNFAERPVKIGKESFYVATNSGGEYTSGGLPVKNQKFYGTYFWLRNVKEGPVGPYHPVMTADGKDMKDMFREVTQMYGGSWGIGRTQLFDPELEYLWAKAHMHDVDLLPDNPERFPHSGYPREGEVFANAYRRHQLAFPVEVVVENGQPVLQIADPRVRADLIAWRKRQAKLH